MKLLAILFLLSAAACSTEAKAPQGKSSYWHSYGVQALREHRVEEAIAHFERATAEDPTWTVAQRSLSEARRKRDAVATKN